MKNPHNIKRTLAGIPGRGVAIVKGIVGAVGYALASLVLVAAVSSCAATWEPFNCNAPGVVCDF